MSSVFGLKASPSSATRLPASAAEVLLQLADHAALLQLVDLDHRGQQLEVVAGVAGELLQRVDVLREAAAAEADARLQELGPDAVVEAHPPRDLDDVGAGLLADVRDLVDERDLGRQERVGGELDHLGAGDVGAHERRVQRRVELGDGVAGPAAVVADRRRGRGAGSPRRPSPPSGTRGRRRSRAPSLPCSREDRSAATRRCRTAPSTSSPARGPCEAGIASTTAWTADRSASPE